ncbi:hypothetical protein [Pseudoduganella sp. UC29_71]
MMPKRRLLLSAFALMLAAPAFAETEDDVAFFRAAQVDNTVTVGT